MTPTFELANKDIEHRPKTHSAHFLPPTTLERSSTNLHHIRRPCVCLFLLLPYVPTQLSSPILMLEYLCVLCEQRTNDVDMNRSEVGLNEAPVAMMASSPTATADGSPLVRPIARFAPRQSPTSGSSDARVPLKKRAIRECFGGDDNEIPEPPRLRRQKVIYWRPSGLQSRGEHTNDHVVCLFASDGADLRTGLDSRPMTIPQLGYKNKTTKSRGDAVPLFGSWSREPLFVDDDNDTEMELESLTNLHSTQQGRPGWTEMQSFAVTPSPHPMEIAQSPPLFPLPPQYGDTSTTTMSPPVLQYYLDPNADADADMRELDQEGRDWFISSKMNELTRLHKHEYESQHEYQQCEFQRDYVEGMDMHHRHDFSPNKSDQPLLVKLPSFPKPGGTIQDLMQELIIPTPDPTPPRDFGVHHHGHGYSHPRSISNNDHYDPNISMTQHPGAFPTTNGWFEKTTNGWLKTNSSFSPARVDHANNSDGNDVNSSSENCDSATAHDQPLLWASNAEQSSAFAPGQATLDWYYGTGYYNASV